MNPETTAIVLIEYQNDFTTPGGVFHDGVKGVMEKNNMLANTIEVATKGRAAGATIMLPFTNAVVPTVDIAGGRVVIELPQEIEGEEPTLT